VEPITLDDDGLVAFGRILGEAVGDVTITELEPAILKSGDTISVAVDNIGNFDVAIDATSFVYGNRETSRLQISNIRRDRSRGFNVDVTRESNTSDKDEGVVTFTGVTVSGTVIPNNTYKVIVYGDAVAANFRIDEAEGDKGGIFTELPYAADLFTFGGADAYAPGLDLGFSDTPATTVPDFTPDDDDFFGPGLDDDLYGPDDDLGFGLDDDFGTPSTPSAPANNFVQNAALSNGPYVGTNDPGLVVNPAFINVAGTGMVALAVLGDIYNLQYGTGYTWNSPVATVTINGITATFEIGKTTATVFDGLTTRTVELKNSAGGAAAAIMQSGRTYIPMATLLRDIYGFVEDVDFTYEAGVLTINPIN